MAANAVLDTAVHTSSGQISSLPTFLQAYVLPTLPLACLAGWTNFFRLDPSHRKRDTIMAARAATEEVLTSRLIEQMRATDLTDIADAAAHVAAAEIVSQTVGHGMPLPTTTQPIAVSARPSRNGRQPEPGAATSPKS
jgi:hypothetical protein